MAILNVLIVEDSEDDLQLLLRELQKSGYEPAYTRVETAGDMHAALQSSSWDVIISDHVMPCFSAPEALAVLKESGLDIPFIIVSGSIGEEVAVEAMRAGAHDYIMKGNLARLVPAIKRELEFAVARAAYRQAAEALRLSEERFRVALKNSPIIVAYADRDLCYTWIHNPHPEFSSEGMIGKRDDELTANEGAKELVRIKQRVIDTGYGAREEIDFSLSDRVLTFDVTAEPLRDSAGEIIGVSTAAVEITDRKRYEEQLKYLSLRDPLTGLYNRAYFSEELNRLSDRPEYPITILSADLDGLKLVNDTLGQDKGDLLLIACAKVLIDVLRKSDLLARTGGDEFAVLLPNTCTQTGEEICKRIRENITRYNQSHPELPLSLSLGAAHAEDGKGSLVDLFKQADDQMYRDKLSRSAGARNRIVEALLAILAERDYITEGHTRRLMELCQRIGEKMNLSSRQLSDLSILSQVHDLGKVGIPDQILFKSRPLTEEEWMIMRRHPEKGRRIALTSPDLSPIADLILKHHERWDGTGYPLGLQKETIPIECRILAVVDAYDAMTYPRPYNCTKTGIEAQKELKRCAGSQFDPDVVDLFITSLSEDR